MGDYKSLLVYLIITVFFAKKCEVVAGVHVCGSNQKLPCDNSECIPRDKWCDGVRNCDDGTDEKYCKKEGWFGPVPDNGCNEKHFVCKHGLCIPAVGRCDKFNDCGDYSDEDGCEETPGGYSVSPEPDEDDRAGVVETFPSSTTSTAMGSIISAAATRRSTPTIYSTTDYYDNREAQESINPNQPKHSNNYDRTRNAQHSYRNEAGQTLPRPQTRGQDTGPGPHFAVNSYLSKTALFPCPDTETSTTVAPCPTTTTPPCPDSTPSPPISPPFQPGPQGPPETPCPHGPQGPSEPSPPCPRTRPITTTTSRPPRPRPPQPRQHPMLLPPRAVVYHPHPRQLYHKNTSKVKLPLFYFATNYTEQIAYNYDRNVERAKRWLVDQRDSSYNWGQDTPRALVALSLITNSFTSDTADNDLMRKGLQAHLGLKLLRNRTELLTVTRLAMYINALHATCQNPRDFMGLDLVDILYKRRHVVNPYRYPTVNPFVYLTLCLSNSYPSSRDIQQLVSLLAERRFPDEMAKDQHILAITALSCILKQYDENHDATQRLGAKVFAAINTLLTQRTSTGSFGSVYSTAIAAQAIMSSNLISWDPRKTLDYLARQQSDDGSFGDLLSTYYSLPALSGRSLVHLRNTQCDRTAPVNETLTAQDILNLPGPYKSVFYSLRVGYPEAFSFALHLTIAKHINLFDIMKVAEFLDPRFRFQYKNSNNALHVYDISNIPNDPERGLHWNLYVLEDSESSVNLQSRYESDIQRLIPRDSQEILYWYLPNV